MRVYSCSITVNIKIIVYGTKIRHFKSKKFSKRKRVRKRIPDECACEVCGSTKKKGNLEDSMII